MNMKVFISWSGERSRQLASALNDFLPNVIQAITPFMSEADIDAGTRWGPRLASELQDTKFGILCLTPENLKSEWMHFEAGALSKSLSDSFVCPCLLGLLPTDVTFPLAQFQLKRADKDGIRGIIDSANNALASNQLDPERIDKAFKKHFPDIKKIIDKIRPPSAKSAIQRPDRELLEELLQHARTGSLSVLKQNVLKEFDVLQKRIRSALHGLGKTPDVIEQDIRCHELSGVVLSFWQSYRSILPSALSHEVEQLAIRLSHYSVSADVLDENSQESIEHLALSLYFDMKAFF